MLWILLLAHFIADYPLQPDSMARRKDNLWVLTLHAGILFSLMVLLVGSIRAIIWPQLLLLSLFHLLQDKLKVWLTNLWAKGVVIFYFLDQCIHLMAIWGLVLWVQKRGMISAVTGKPVWAIILMAYLLVTYVWFITERVIHHVDVNYLKSVNETKVPRMLARAGLVSMFLLVRSWISLTIAPLISYPYPPTNYRKRALLTDVSVSLAVMVFLTWSLRMS